MQLGAVIGRVTSTTKHPSLEGWRMLVVQPLNSQGGADGEPIIAIDQLGSGRNDRVILTGDGPAVREMVGWKNSPVRWAILGVADPVNSSRNCENSEPGTRESTASEEP